MAIMFCITGSMAAMLSLEDCKITFGASPLAWGFTTWWAIDTGAKLTLYPWRNPVKLRKTILSYKNLSTHAFLSCAALHPARCVLFGRVCKRCRQQHVKLDTDFSVTHRDSTSWPLAVSSSSLLRCFEKGNRQSRDEENKVKSRRYGPCTLDPEANRHQVIACPHI
jgi:hypothetical protein